ncbi:MAG: hypothetical protein IVW54_02280 [Candidatus Binataceae bacterium]|nr:hypothetical protein [Candidatus Binataceae bacterium]
MSAGFPEQFRDLERFAATWAIVSRHGRYQHRVRSTMDEVREFYDAITSRLEAIMKYLNRVGLAELPASDRTLLYLMLAYMEASRAVEVIGATEVHWGFDSSRLKIIDGAEL